MKNRIFKNLLTIDDYLTYCQQKEVHNLFGFNLSDVERNLVIRNEISTDSVDVNNKNPFPPDFGDLIRLHYIVKSRKSSTILEFGSGKSTLVFASALRQNRLAYEDIVNNKLRKSNAFEIHTVDTSEYWISQVRNIVPIELLDFVKFNFS
jgi:hypothetical protein